MRRLLMTLILTGVVTVVAGCDLLFPAGSGATPNPTLPAPATGAPRLSPSIEIPPPID
jgi:hypothetical protein